MKVAFLDRDGTLIVDPPDFRVKTVRDLHFFEDTLEALRYLNSNGFEIIIITNQAGIGEGVISEEQFWLVHNEMLSRLKERGVNVLDTFMCSASPDSNDPWRKPNPGMLIEAAAKYNIDLSSTFMTGDRHADVLAGVNAGCKSILVETGWDTVEVAQDIFVAPTLLDAAKHIVHSS
jgi:D-glycero-D-manno-heptose 1,7-bisphosphate phosphatase